MPFILHLNVLTINEFNYLNYEETGERENGYALWFFLDKDQSCFVDFSPAEQSLRQPEFVIKESHKENLQIELFRRSSDEECLERIFVGEASVPLSFLVNSSENHLIVEIMRNNGELAATILLKIEKLSLKGRTISRTSSPIGSGSARSIAISEGNLESPDILVTDGSLNQLPNGSSAVRDDNVLAVVYTSQPQYVRCNGAPDILIEKMTLSGSPIMHVRPEPIRVLDLLLPEQQDDGDSVVLLDSLVTSESPLEDEAEELGDANCLTVPEISLDRSQNTSLFDVKGLVSLEIIAAQNLPRERRMLRVHYQNNPFVVISFGKQSFKTKVIRRTVNPVWKEKLFFSIKESEANYYIMFSVYDHDKLSYNSCIGTTNIKASLLLDHPNEIQKLALSLRLSSSNSAPDDVCLLVKGCFISYDMLRKNFWEILAKQYDHDDNGKLNRLELTTMLESIGSTLSENTIDGIMRKLEKDENSEVSMSSIVSALEALTVRAKHPEHPEENIVLIENCPICCKHFKGKSEDIDVITHLAVCAAKDSGKLDGIVMGGFITEDYASRKWFMKLLSFMTFGGYRIGKNNANILVQDRKTGKLLEEKMPTYIRLGIRWMHQQYGTSHAVDSYMVRQIFQNLTVKQGRKYDDPSSTRYIPEFIRYHKINIEEVLEPIENFYNFNEFFFRKLKPNARALFSTDPCVCVSPADCRLNVFPTIDEATELWIKGSNFSLANLLKDEKLAEYFLGGSIVVCRLAPQDYHRFHSPVDGNISITYHIPGTYFTVNPMAVRQKTDVYTENSRTIMLIDSEYFGKVAFVAIGAMMVGSIKISCPNGSAVKRMDELGYFAFGGSTIVILFPSNRIVFDKDLLQNSQEQLETLVQVGNSIGRTQEPHLLVSSRSAENSLASDP